jgi:hypothetical protein
MAGSGGGSGGIALSPMFDPVTGEHLPGLAAVDSDGTVGCGSDGTIDVDGSGSVIRADGQPGCPGELPPAGSGNGCGQIRTYAPGPPGCVMPACSSSGTVAPSPGRMGVRLTRAPVDWRYNCVASYPVSWDIRGCPDAATTPSYMAQLTAAVGTSGLPSGFSSYTAAGFPCTVDGPPGTSVTIPEGNWVVDCHLSVKRTLVFAGGNVVFDGDVALTSSGDLQLNVANTNSFSWTPGQAVDHRDHSAAAAWAYLRDGTLSKAGSASFTLERTMLHLGATSTVAMTGGDGSVRWIAPDAGPFEDLAMWSDGIADHGFAGQAGLGLEGVFFAPYARITYSGNGSQKQVAAQFISEKLAVSGNGLLLIEPRYDRAIRFPQFPVVELIR